MLHQGRFPLALHALVEYLAGALLIAAPWLFGFQSGGATAVSIVLGVIVLAVAASTEWRLALMPAIPIPFHLALDLALGGVLIASPFIFGFSNETAPTAFFIVLGVFHLLFTLGTRYTKTEPEAGAPRRRGRFRRGRASSSAPTPPASPPPPAPDARRR